MSTRKVMDSTSRTRVVQLQGNGNDTYQTADLRHAKMCYKRIAEAAKILDRAKLAYERAAGKLGVKESERLLHWVNYHTE